MDDSNNKLTQLWQSCQIDSSNDPKEKRKHLIKLLDCCLFYFNELNPEQENTLNQSDLSKTTQYYIGNWLIHQFIIDLSGLNNNPNSTWNISDNEPEYNLFYEYFMNGIGWKLLKCFSFFNYRNGSIYNEKFAKILILLLKTFILNYDCDDDGDDNKVQETEKTASFSQKNQEEWSQINLDLFLSNTNFKEDVYLKTIKNESLSPAKVKSWIKNSRYLMNKANKRKKKKQNNNFYLLDSDDDEEEMADFDFNKNLYKQRTKNHDLLPFYKARQQQYQQQSSIESQFNDDDGCQQTKSKSEYKITKPTAEELILIIQNILSNSVLFEISNNVEQTLISNTVIEELTLLIDQLVNKIAEKKSLMEKPDKFFLIVKHLKNLIILSCFVVCIHSDGIKMIYRNNVIKSLIKYIDWVQAKIKEESSSVPVVEENHFVSVLFTDYFRTLCLLLRLMITISHTLVQTKEIDIFLIFMNQIFENKMETFAHFLIKQSTAQFIQKNSTNNESMMFQFVDLLKELQITIQYSQSLLLHKKICTKKRHNRCNLVQLMAHHFFHDNFDVIKNNPKEVDVQQKSKPTTEAIQPCISSLVYCLMIKLIFIYSNNHQNQTIYNSNIHSSNTGGDDKLICYISNQLSILISCCCSLRKYCKNLLHFAISTNRTNPIRNAIFNIIEFNVKIQRKNFSDSTFLTDHCSFCSYNDICEKELSPSFPPISEEGDYSENQNQNNSLYSEGYSTDNGRSSIIEDSQLKFSTINLNCTETNCLIKSLSSHYITLLKCENTGTRQTVFKHLFNLFSYLNLKSRKSILLHVIFPIFENHKKYPSDVSFFVLHLLIAMTKQCEQHRQTSDNLELLNIFVKTGVLTNVKQFICHINPFYMLNYKSIIQCSNTNGGVSNFRNNIENPLITDLSSLSVELLKNLIKCELIYFARMTHLNTDQAEIISKIDIRSFNMIPLFIDMFREQFDDCIKFKTIVQQQLDNSITGKKAHTAATLEEHIDLYKKISFNILDLNEQELNKLFLNLWCLLKLLSIGNNILDEYPYFRNILNHEDLNFSQKLITSFRKLSMLTFNEIKLFFCLNFDIKQNDEIENQDFEKQKYLKFCDKLLQVLEQMIFFITKLEPINLETDCEESVSKFVENQLLTFVEPSVLRWQCSNVNLMTELLKVLIRVAFDSNENLDLNSKHNYNDYSSLDYVIRQQRTSSFDSVMSDNETNNDLEFDVESDGYDADIECLRSFSSAVNNSKNPQDPKQHSHDENIVPKQSKIKIKNVDLCKTVFKYLSNSISKRNSISNQSQQDLKQDLDIALQIINLVIQYCRDNTQNTQILFENDFTEIIMEDFRFLLTSSGFEEKHVKIALLELFAQLTSNGLRPKEIKMFIELFKPEDSDFEFLLSIFNKILFVKNRPHNPPQNFLRFPTMKIKKKNNENAEPDWIDLVIDNINDNYTNCEYDIGFKSFACALPLSPSAKHTQLKYSLVFWIHLEKLPSLVNKYLINETRLKNRQQIDEPKNFRASKNIRQIHIISLVFDCVTLELWFDYVYNRFVYRICKETNGKMIYLNESFVTCNPNLLGQWTFVGIDLQEKCDPSNRSHSIQIGHNVNCSREKVFKWSYPAALFNSDSKNNALFIGSCQEIVDCHYDLSNVFMFKEILTQSALMILYSLGPDFNNFHHLENETIQQQNYFVFPHRIINETNLEMLTSILQTSVAIEARLILDNLCLVYKASQMDVFYIYMFGNKNLSLNNSMNPFKLLATNQHMKKANVNFILNLDEPHIFQVKLNSILNVQHKCNIAKTISDSGGISIFLFLFLFLLEKSDNQIVYNKSLELILNVYHSHYYHKTTFDNHYGGYQLLLYVMEKSRRAFTPNLLKIYSKFTIYSKENHAIILSLNIAVFLNSWKVWIKNINTSKQFFQQLNSLVMPSNPYRNFNLIYLKKIGAFSHLIHMIEDIYMNYFDDYPSLDLESLDELVSLLHTMIENVSDFNLIQIVLNCLLLLQNSEWLHVNQTKASFYYLFPSTWLTFKEEDHQSNNIERIFSSSKSNSIDFQKSENMHTDEQTIEDDWEIVSEFLENASPLSSESEESSPQNKNKLLSQSTTTNTTSTFINKTETVSCELISMIYQYLDQIPDVHLLDSVFKNVSCLDFLIVLVNNPSANVRQTALRAFFKLFKLHFDKESSMDNHSSSSSSPDAKILRNKTLYLLMVSNQLYNYIADDVIMNLCLSFILNLNSSKVYDLLNRDCDQTFLKKICSKISLENFIPLLALLPKCIPSISFCYKILSFFHQMIKKMSLQQINELQKEYGLVQSMSKLIINLNTQLSIPAEDRDKYTKENLNEEIYRIIYSISFNYILHNDPQYYVNFLNFTNYYSIIERKVTIEVSQIFRQIQVSIYQASFEAFDKFQMFIDGRQNLSSLEDSEKSLKFTSSHELTTNNKARPFGIQPKTMLDRLKTIVKNSILFIMCRNPKIPLTEKEKYFQREVLFHLLKIISQSQNLDSDRNNVGKNAWTKLISNSKDFFKSHLNRILLFLISHLQTMDDRIFALNLLFEKTKEFANIKLFVDKNDDNFPLIFNEFLNDLIEKGVKELNIYSSSKVNEFVLSNSHTFDNNEFQSDYQPLSMNYVYKKFKEQFKISNDDGHSQQNSSVVVWHEHMQELILKYENEILRTTNKIFSNMSLVFNKVLDAAKSLNNRIMSAQDKEKKNYLLHLKRGQLKNKTIEKRLMRLIGQLLHEKSCWFLKEYYPESWELSPFESRGRIRKKLERCFLEIDNRYVRDWHSKKLRSKHLFATFLENNSKFFNSISMNDLDRYREEDGSASTPLLYMASVILYDEQISGEILIKKNSLQFMANSDDQRENYLSFSSKKAFFQSFIIDFIEIQEIIKCRYELQNTAVEIVLISGLTYLIAFESMAARDECYQHLMSNRDLLPNLTEGMNLITLTQMWRERLISNFDYLMQLNKLSGRTFNDLMQYPVFPFVLADYSSDILNLLDQNSFRDLSRPIAVQKKEREKYYIDQYNYIKMENSLSKDRDKNDINSFQFIVTSAPYHYGAHYSNSGIVLYYLVRLPPYTQMFLQYQDKNFDIPDRSFHSIQTTWRLATEDSTNGFKELIPEFFYLPEFLMNAENFNLGVRQNGERVDNVILPPWCRNNARLFTLINLQALESNYVTQHLNHWFDLIFGYKQTGKAAVDAINVFHPATHFTADLSKIEDVVKRQALKTMIKTFGQMPSQLFNLPHPTILSEITLPLEDNHQMMADSPSMGEVIGLKWGNYVGSPINSMPMVCFQKKFPQNISKLLALPTNDVMLLPRYSSPLVVYNHSRNIFINTSYIVFYALCTWSPLDVTIWIRNQKDSKFLFPFENSLLDQICICESIPDYEWFLVGYHSGIIVAFQLKFNKNFDMHDIKLRDQPHFFLGHESTITSITINNNYNVALSTDQNGVCIVWDMNKQQYLRTIMERSDPNTSAILSTISDTLGDLAVITHSYHPRRTNEILSSKLNIFTLNGTLISDIQTEESQPYFTALCYSTCQEGLSINVIATGMSNGTIKLWSSWDLTLVREIPIDLYPSPIKSISFSFKCDHLYLVNEENYIIALKSVPNGSGGNSSLSSSSSSNFRFLNLTNLLQ